jgi:nucleoside-diphosphate-sugar epimerase
LTDARAVARLGEVDGVAHVAAVLPASHEASTAAAAANRAMDVHVLALCAQRRVPLVYASSVAVYDSAATATGVPLDESAPLRPGGAYAQEKAWAEREGARLLGTAGAPFTALRLCAPYGPRQWRGSVIQRFIEQALDGGPLYYFGTGSREQSFTHVRDIGRAFLLALGPTLRAEPSRAQETPRGSGGVFNISAAAPVTMRELALLVARRAGLVVKAVRASGEDDPLEGALSRHDVRAAERVLGWRPEIGLAEGVDECLRVEAERRAACR